MDWPHKAESKSYFPPKGASKKVNLIFCAVQIKNYFLVSTHCSECPIFPGYAFLLFQDESSVQALIDACIQEDGKLYLCVSSPTIKDKPVSFSIKAASTPEVTCNHVDRTCVDAKRAGPDNLSSTSRLKNITDSAIRACKVCK